MSTLRKANWPYIISYPVMTVVGSIATMSGAMLLLFPSVALSESSLGIFLPPVWEVAWPAIHTIGGVSLVIGVITRRPSFEAAGCVLLTSTFACQCLAVLAIRGFETGFIAGITLGSLALGLAVRAYMLVWASKRAIR